MDIRETYRRFKQWQLNPFNYDFDENQNQVCNNCGNSFNGNYCPHCSQNKDHGRVTWKNVWLSIVEVWGMHSRSLPFTIVQLFLRPGYLISDYINGKRQVSFPPFKMLTLVALLGILVDYLTGFDGFMTISINDHRMMFFDDLFKWLNHHPDAMTIVIGSFVVIPIYFLYRQAPKNTHHSIPQGVFIQVFLATLYLLLNIIYDITDWIPFVNILGVVLVLTTYRQLFGYSIWGTIWRSIVATICAGLISLIVIFSDFMVHNIIERRRDEIYGSMILIGFSLILVSIILFVCSIINNRSKAKSPKESQQYVPGDCN